MTSEEVEERTCTCGAGHGSLEGHTAWCAWLEPKPKDFDTWWSCDGQYLDPDTADVPWFDKRRGLAEYAFKAGAASSTWPDFIAPPKHDNAAEGWTDPDLPNFRLVWQVAREMGYAVGLHGSMKRDCDMIAVPWMEACSTAEALIDALCVALNAREVGPREPKPNGRLAVNLQIDGWFRVIDLSIVTASRVRPAGEVVAYLVEDSPVRGIRAIVWPGELQQAMEKEPQAKTTPLYASPPDTGLREALTAARSMLISLAGDPRTTIAENGSLMGDEVQAALLDQIDAALTNVQQERGGR